MFNLILKQQALLCNMRNLFTNINKLNWNLLNSSTLVQENNLMKLSRNEVKSYSSFTSIGTSANRKERKRFYKNVSVCESSLSSDSLIKSFEINLDNRKLKTPSGRLFVIRNELLANMIAMEWDSQQTTIKQHTMHMTSLLNTCLDNPNKLSKEKLISNLNEYLQTDTLLYFDSNSIEKLENLQETKWRPVVDWFNNKFTDLNLKINYEISLEPLKTDSVDLKFSSSNSFIDYLNRNFNLNSIIAFNYIAECLKSVILTVALLEKLIKTVDEAAALSNLEQEHQFDQWGKVEWYHDINENELKARVSAALVFIYLSDDSKYFLDRSSKSFDLNKKEN